MKSIYKLLSLVVLGASFSVGADQVQYLAYPQESMSAFANAIDGAQSSIDIATYIFEPCHASVRVMMDKLAARAKAGVKVRILLDAFEQKKEQQENLLADFKRHGIQVRFFDNSIAKIDLRMHSKFTVVDGRLYISGGRNYADNYWGISASLNYIDRDVLVTGKSAAVAARSFTELWNSDMTSVPDQAAFTPWNSFCGSDISARMTQVQAYLTANAAGVVSAIPVRTCASVKFTSDHPDYSSGRYGPGWSDGKNSHFLSLARLRRKITTREILAFIAGAKHKLQVENWGYMPIYDVEAAFTAARDARVKIDVMANQDMEDDGPRFFREAEEYSIATISARDSIKGQTVELLSSLGSMSNVFELTPAGSRFYMHGKVMVRDTVDAQVSSFNMDSRSANINLETSVTAVNCPDLAADVQRRSGEVRAAFDRDQTSGLVPEKEPASVFAKIFSVLGVTEF